MSLRIESVTSERRSVSNQDFAKVHRLRHVEEMDAYIISLRYTAEVEQRLTKMREKHFPKERNFLRAHVTLFHALPASERAKWEMDLQVICAGTPVFDIVFSEPYSLGRGVALRVQSPELKAAHAHLQNRWRDFLTPQDRQGYRPHCTIQNKVEPSIALALLEELRSVWTPLEASATGLDVWRYAGGPWELENSYKFK